MEKMRPVDFIRQKVQQDLLRFDFHSVSYEYMSGTRTHLVLIEPASLEDQGGFAEALFDLEDQFMQLFPWEEIHFITSEEFLKLENPTYKWIRKQQVEGYRTPVIRVRENKSMFVDSVTVPSKEEFAFFGGVGESNYSLAA